MSRDQASPLRGTARVRLLDAAVDMIPAQGYAATTVDDLCAAAGVTKGAFFHHFESKDALAFAAAEHWTTTTGAMFATADYRDRSTPTERVLDYVDFRASLIDGAPSSFTCLVGTMVQEAHATHPAIRDACATSILEHSATFEPDFDAALTQSAGADGVDAAGLARHTQAVLQGSFILAKATQDPTQFTNNLDHLRRYLIQILEPPRLLREGRSN